jgi:diguanylate cyclase (GGDEF)-like protein
MANHRTRLGHSGSRQFNALVCLLGLGLLGWALTTAVAGGWQFGVATLVALPLVVVVARFPLVLDGEDGGIEIGFDSGVLMFLLCAFDAPSAISVWGVAVLLTQLVSGKRPIAQAFNVGAGILAGGAAAALFQVVRGGEIGTPRELLAVVVAAAVYFIVDFGLSAVSLAIDSGSPLREHLARRGTLLAIFCFVPLELLGYLAAVVLRDSPWWTLVLLVIPLVTLLVATRAITRGREDARRLTVLLEAAVRVQSVHVGEQIDDALLHDARRLVRLKAVELRGAPPQAFEIGAQVRRGKNPVWIVAPARDRARSTVTADQHALDALAVLGSDAFARLQLTADMVHYARHDPLTDLPNRGILLDRVAHAVRRARRSQVNVALLFIDLDGFKPVNDRHGHAAGDAVLVEVARRLLECTRAGDTVARLGGDEFAVLLEDIADGEAAEIAERILTALSARAVVGSYTLPIAASIGVAFGDGSESGEILLRNADLAMYEAKGRGKAQVVVYEQTMGRSRIDALNLVEKLRRAIETDAMDVVYQPVVAVVNDRIVGVEALVRWEEDGVDVPADHFVRIAEVAGLIGPLGELVLARVARDAADLRAAAGGPISISVNVAAQQLRDPSFVGIVERTVSAMSRTNLVLEITEREGVSDDPVVLAAIRTISAFGVRFAIDDFGVGFSSIGYLQSVPAHVVKIDASLASEIDRDARACAVLAGIVSMAGALSLDVVIEGIERPGQLEAVRNEVGARLVQGFLLHRPMPFAALLPVVRANRGGGEQVDEEGTSEASGTEDALAPTA